MCIIALKTANAQLSNRTIRRCWNNNPDGAGFMYSPGDGTVRVVKGYMKLRSFITAYREHLGAHPSATFVLHFRIGTSGKQDANNCHPHVMSDRLAFVHNGIFKIDVPVNSPVSDTIIFRDTLLKSLSDGFYKDASTCDTLGDIIGTGNNLVFLDGDGYTRIVNEDYGEWDRGVWFSNTSYLPDSRRWSSKWESKWGGGVLGCTGAYEAASDELDHLSDEELAHLYQCANCGQAYDRLDTGDDLCLGCSDQVTTCEECGLAFDWRDTGEHLCSNCVVDAEVTRRHTYRPIRIQALKP